MTGECFQEEEIRRARADTDETRRKLLAGVPPHPNPQRFANPLGETHELATFRESAWVATLLSRVHERPFMLSQDVVGAVRSFLEPICEHLSPKVDQIFNRLLIVVLMTLRGRREPAIREMPGLHFGTSTAERVLY